MSTQLKRKEDTSPRRCLLGSGELADAIRALNWGSTPLGPTSSWSDTLLGTVNMMLSSDHPILLMWGPEMVMLYNDAFRPLLTDRHPQGLGMKGREFWTDVWPVVGEQLEAVLYQGKSISQERALVPILRNGVLSDAYFTYSYSPTFEPNGEIAGIITICEEVTSTVIAEQERLAAERQLIARQEQLDRTLAALHTERARLLSAIQQAPVFFALLEGPNHVFTMGNELYFRLVGGRNIMGRTVAEAIPEAENQGYVALLDRVFNNGETVSMQGARIDLEWTPGLPPEERYVDFVYQPLREADASISAIICIGIDVTESKRAAKALMQNEKLAAVGRLAASIAHEINNPLEAVMNLIYLARNSDSLGATREYLDSADRELRRMTAITNQTLSFNRQSSTLRPVSCADLVSSVTNIYQGRLTNSGITVEKKMRSQTPVLCFDGEIRQVLNNLVSNASDAMQSSGGRLLLRSRNSTEWSTGRKGLTITVADTGTGMPPEVLRRIFDPFFTTKELGGTGLGLWVSRDIVTRHRGSLKVRSSQRRGHSGTVFQLFLPFENQTA